MSIMLTKEELRRHRQYYTDQIKLGLYDEMRDTLAMIAARADLHSDDDAQRECMHIYAAARALLARLPKE